MAVKGKPLTNSKPINTTISVRRYINKFGVSVNQVLDVVEDFAHYRGQQVSSALAGYRRGERVKLGISLIDLAGRVLPPVPLGEYMTPEWSTAFGVTTYGLTYYDDTVMPSGRYKLQALGLNVSGIRFKDSLLRDERGQPLYSGFMILRGEITPRKKHSGVLLGMTQGPLSLEEPERNALYPYLSLRFAFEENYAVGYRPGGHVEQGLATPPNLAFGEGDVPVFTAPYWASYHSPDLLIEEAAAPKLDAADRLRLAGYASMPNLYENVIGSTVSSSWAQYQRYIKLYRAQGNQAPPRPNRPAIGATTRVLLAHKTPVSSHLGKQNADDVNPLLDAEVPELWARMEPSIKYNATDVKRARLQPGSLVVKTADWEAVDASLTASDRRAAIVDWMGAEGETTQAEAIAQELITYIPTGHYQPLTPSVLNALPTEGTGEDKVYRFDGVEVWGGDTYVNFVDMLTEYPQWDFSAAEYYDYAEALIVPLESKYNTALRQGRSVAANGVYPSAVAYRATGGENLDHLRGGIQLRQREEWNYNPVLLRKETVCRYQPLPADFLPQPVRPCSGYLSQTKTYGQTTDAWRRFLPLDTFDADADSGSINGMVAQFGGVYLLCEHALRALPLSERAAVATDGGTLALGTGRDIGQIETISTTAGLSLPLAVCQTDRAFYFFDVPRARLWRFSQAGLDDLSKRGVLAPVAGLSTTLRAAAKLTTAAALLVHPRTGQLHLSLHGTGLNYAWVYDENADAWEDRRGEAPLHAAVFGPHLLMARPANADVQKLFRAEAGLRGQMWGVPVEARLEFSLAADAPLVMDNVRLLISPAAQSQALTLEYSTEGVGVTVSLNATPPSPTAADARFQGDAWRYPLLGPGYDAARLRGRLLRVKLVVPASPTTLDLRLTEHQTYYRPSP